MGYVQKSMPRKPRKRMRWLASLLVFAGEVHADGVVSGGLEQRDHAVPNPGRATGSGDEHGRLGDAVEAWLLRIARNGVAEHHRQKHAHFEPLNDRCTADGILHAEQVCKAKAQKFTPIRRQVLQALLASHRPLGETAVTLPIVWPAPSGTVICPAGSPC